MVDAIIFAVLLTLAVEQLIYGFADRFNLKSYLMMFGVNIVLNVSMNIVLSYMSSYQAYITTLVIAEVLVFIIESITFYLFSQKRLWFAILIAFTANIASLALGNMFNYFHTIENATAFYVLIAVFILILSIQLGFVISSYIIRKRSDQ